MMFIFTLNNCPCPELCCITTTENDYKVINDVRLCSFTSHSVEMGCNRLGNEIDHNSYKSLRFGAHLTYQALE